MLYHMELVARERQEKLLRDAEESRMRRMVGGRSPKSNRPQRRWLFGRS